MSVSQRRIRQVLNHPTLLSTCTTAYIATRCFEAGIDAKSSKKKFLGHYSISITLDLYTHITNEKAKEDMNKLENLYKKISIDRILKIANIAFRLDIKYVKGARKVP